PPLKKAWRALWPGIGNITGSNSSFGVTQVGQKRSVAQQWPKMLGFAAFTPIYCEKESER
ncbi:MAG TPA: hypothetical protein PK820_08325, partial [Candidatus Competibacteraceae bacterium]|nr:hypothetical protein [Candidatus Competibacteraceae bacterium]